MSKRRILLCDDDGTRVTTWAEALAAIPEVADSFEIDYLQPEEFGKAFHALKERKLAAREDGATIATWADDEAAEIDGAAILVLDYDLTPVTLAKAAEKSAVRQHLVGESGEMAAYLARCYSTATYIVLVNQAFQSPTFDLTMQRFVSSMADLNVSNGDLTTSELWLGSDGPFRPWSWPRLLDAPVKAESCLGLFELGDRILETLGLHDEDHLPMFNSRQSAVLPQGVKTTFDHLCESDATGLRGKDQMRDADARKRIAAAAVRRWLEYLVLPGQNVLVDAPHLVERYPVLLTGDLTDRALWDRTANLSTVPPVRADALAVAERPVSQWMSRPVWSLPLAADVAARLSAEERPEAPGLVFCEDVSAFHPPYETEQVRTDVPGPYPQRSVKGADGIDYHPRSRLLQ